MVKVLNAARHQHALFVQGLFEVCLTTVKYYGSKFGRRYCPTPYCRSAIKSAVQIVAIVELKY